MNALDGEAPVGGRARYNMGNSLYRMGRLEESIEAYKAGLRIEPDDIDMKYNLEYVMRQLQQQEEQESRNGRDRREDQANQDGQDNREDPGDRNNGGPEPDEEESPEAQPPPREGELSRAEAERLLNALNRDEQDIQRRLRRQQATQVNPEKDW